MDASMSYITHSLGQSETLLYKARFPIFYHLAAWFLFGACLIAGIAAYAGGYGVPGYLLVLAGIVLLLGLLLPIWTTEIGVTNQRFIYKRGLLWRTTQELQLRAIEEVNLRQGLLGRLFNFGQLDLRGTGVDDLTLPTLADPIGLRKALQDGMAAAVRAATVPPRDVVLPLHA
jgi:uncharacterized membrane protein YdbT with pleckstrin-like domain